MNEIDVEAKKKESARDALLHQKRVEEQERNANALQALQKNEFKAHAAAAERAADRFTT